MPKIIDYLAYGTYWPFVIEYKQSPISTDSETKFSKELNESQTLITFVQASQSQKGGSFQVGTVFTQSLLILIR